MFLDPQHPPPPMATLALGSASCPLSQGTGRWGRKLSVSASCFNWGSASPKSWRWDAVTHKPLPVSGKRLAKGEASHNWPPPPALIRCQIRSGYAPPFLLQLTRKSKPKTRFVAGTEERWVTNTVFDVSKKTNKRLPGAQAIKPTCTGRQ